MTDCFIITAIGAPDSPVFKTAERHFEIFAKAAELAQMKAIRLDQTNTDLLGNELWQRLQTARIVIADLTHPNVNAAYELGIRHGLKMPAIIVTTDTNTLPFDFRHHNAFVLNYDGEDAVRLAKRLRSPIEEISSGVFKDSRFRIVAPGFSDGGEVNHSFYDAYFHALRNAKRSVTVVGSGFDDDSPMGETTMRALVVCASRLNQFTRVEIAGPEKLEWWRLVDRYLRPMPNVHLYVPVTREDILLRDIAVFDEHDASNALVQLMVPTKMPVVKHLHTRKLERAGYALFAHSQPFAHDVHEVVIDLAQRGKIRQLRTAEDVTEYLGVAPDWNVIQKGEDVQIYFAYGSNLNPTQMSKRVMKHRPVGVAYAKGFELAFSIPGSTWAGAVANIREEEGRFLYGVVYEIDAHGLDRLDFFEGVKQGEYRREMITVYLHDRDAPVQAWVYRGEHRDAIAETPGKIYLDTIVEGAKSHGLPPSYIKQLTGYQT